jgi:hypothetical protein
MDERILITSRRSLHGVAELVLAGPQYRAHGDIRLRVVPGGFATVTGPEYRVDGDRLITPTGALSLDGGTFADLAAAAGLTASRLDDVYSGGPRIDVNERIELDPLAAGVISGAFTRGDAALRELAPDEEPVLWPEHFDVAITLDEVNYGVSPGDDAISTPYAYVGPWTPRSGDFWNASFGASRPLTELPDVAAVLEFFRTGRILAAKG